MTDLDDSVSIDARLRGTTLVHVTTVPQSFAFLKGQLRYMMSKGFRVEVVASPGEYSTTFEIEEGVPIHAVEMPRQITPFRDLIAVWRLYRLFQVIKPTIVHAHTPKGGLLGSLAAWIARVPIRIYHIRGLPYISAQRGRRLLMRWTEWISCRLAHRVLAVSHSMRNIAIQDKLCHPGKIAVPLWGSGNGVDAETRFNPDRIGLEQRISVRRSWNIPEGAIVVGFVGRLVRDKGLIDLAEAWRELRREALDVHLLLVGPLETEDPIPKDTVEVLRKDSRVHFTGRNRDTPQLYAAMDIVVLPSYREGFPNVPLEAAAMGLPVVSSRIPGCSDAVIDQVTGLLVPAGDADSLREALRTYIENPVLRIRHGHSGRRRVLREFVPEALWHCLYDEYRSLLRAHIPERHVDHRIMPDSTVRFPACS